MTGVPATGSTAAMPGPVATMPPTAVPVVTGAGGEPGSAGAPTMPEPEPAMDGPSYATTVEPIVVAKCATAGCHVDGGVLGGSADVSMPPVYMVLEIGQGYAVLTQGPSVELPTMRTVGSGLDDSYLWHKLNNTHEAEGGVGLAMPIGTPLTAAELAAIQAWIEGGASP
jgi:hypothetical protein